MAEAWICLKHFLLSNLSIVIDLFVLFLLFRPVLLFACLSACSYIYQASRLLLLCVLLFVCTSAPTLSDSPLFLHFSLYLSLFSPCVYLPVRLFAGASGWLFVCSYFCLFFGLLLSLSIVCPSNLRLTSCVFLNCRL